MEKNVKLIVTVCLTEDAILAEEDMHFLISFLIEENLRNNGWNVSVELLEG